MPIHPSAGTGRCARSCLPLASQQTTCSDAKVRRVFWDVQLMTVCLAPGVVYGAATQWPQMLPHLGVPYSISSLDGSGFAKITAILVLLMAGARAAFKLAASRVPHAEGAYR